MSYENSAVFARPAMIGDRGTVIGANQEPGSGMATLEIETADGEIVSVDGDWRMIQAIAYALEGHEVEVVESEGSDYSCHSIHLLQPVE